MDSLLLQPTVLHLSFKVTWADGSLRKPDLLLGPRTDNWSQGTSTPLVLRLYRRAISVSAKWNAGMVRSKPVVQSIMQKEIRKHWREWTALRGANRTLTKYTIPFLQRDYKPALHVQHDPSVVTMMTKCFEK